MDGGQAAHDLFGPALASAPFEGVFVIEEDVDEGALGGVANEEAFD